MLPHLNTSPFKYFRKVHQVAQVLLLVELPFNENLVNIKDRARRLI